MPVSAHRHHNSPKTAHAGGFHMQGHPAAAWGLFPLQEPPKRRALASEDSRSYAPGRLGPMRKTRKQVSKKIEKITTGPLQACPFGQPRCSLEARPMGYGCAENRVQKARSFIILCYAQRWMRALELRRQNTLKPCSARPVIDPAGAAAVLNDQNMLFN